MKPACVAVVLGGNGLSDVAIKYRAFLSYSHTDTAWAKWLHRALEGFRIDKDLAGRQTPLGSVPTTLRPIFRDRDDFSGGHTLTDATVTALDASAALIVLCSKVSANRPAVNEEVRLFRSRHADRPVIPVIIDGTWPENFPQALRYELAADGTVSDRPITILGPDLRESGDGKNLGLAKTVASLTGLAPDDVYRRAERERHRQARLHMAVAVVITMLVIAGGGLFWQSYRQKQMLTEISALVDKYSLVTPAQAAVPGAKQSLTQAITAIAEGAATDPRYAQALALLKAGKPNEAEPLLKAVAADKEKRADRDAKDAAAAYRNLASIAAVSDPGRAREYYAEAARLDPSDVEGMFKNGWYQKSAGQVAAAQAAYARVIATAAPGVDDAALFWAKVGIGGIEQERGDFAAALASYQDARGLVDRLAKAIPADAAWQPVWLHDLSVSYERIGDLRMAQSDTTNALQAYHDSLRIGEQMAQSYPGDTIWQHDLSASYLRLGEVEEQLGNLSAALVSYQTSLAIVERSNPNGIWNYDLAAAYDRLGNVQAQEDNQTAALNSFRASLAILQPMVNADPNNADIKGGLVILYAKVGDVQANQGNLTEAFQTYRDGLAIDRTLPSDAGNPKWQYESHSAIFIRTGNLAFRFVLANDFAQALQAADEAISVAPDATWLYTNRAHALMFLDRTDEARALYFKYRGQSTEDGESWETAILKDFTILRKAGLTNPLMDEIEKLFASAR